MEKKQSFAMSYTQTVGLHSLSVIYEDIDPVCFLFLCFGSFCVTHCVFKLSPDLKYAQQQKLLVVEQLPFCLFDQYRLQTALQSRCQLRLISPPGNLFIIVLSFVPQSLFGSFCCSFSIYLYYTPVCNNHMLCNTKRKKQRGTRI